MTQQSDRTNRYRIVSKLCSGGMADIFLGIQLDQQVLERLVVIKKIHSVADADPDTKGMFADEARIIATLNHPHIVQIFDFTEEEDSFHIIMEYIDGENLGYILTEHRKKEEIIPFPIAFRLMDQALEALQYIHTATSRSGEPLNIVHRDLDPRNLMVDSNGYLKIIDFGVAKAVVQTELTAPGLFKGKLSHVAPEIFTQSDIDHRADIYSIGLVLFEMVTGDRPYRFGKSSVLVETIKRIVDEPLPKPRDINPNIPEELEQIILKACHKNREERYQTAEALHQALMRFAHGNNGFGVASNAEVKEWFNSHFHERLSKRRNFENMTLQKAKKALDGIRPSRPLGLMHTSQDGERSGIAAVETDVYSADCRVTGADSASGVSFATGMIPPPGQSHSGRGMRPSTPAPPAIGPFNTDDNSDTFTGASKNHFFKVALGTAGIAIAASATLLFVWGGALPWSRTPSSDVLANNDSVSQIAGSLSVSPGKDSSNTPETTASDSNDSTRQVAKSSVIATSAVEEGAADVVEESSSKTSSQSRNWYRHRSKRRQKEKNNDAMEIESIEDDPVSEARLLEADTSEAPSVIADVENSKDSTPESSISKLVPPKARNSIVPKNQLLTKTAPKIAAVHPPKKEPRYISGSGDWSGKQATQKGCGSCHAVDATTKTASQWKYFFSHNRHRRNGDLKALFSPTELRRVQTHLISIVEKSKARNNGIAGIR